MTSGGSAGLPAVRVPAVHVSGVRSLPPGRADLELRFSDAGLHIYDLAGRALVGRLHWDEIDAIELKRLRLGRPRASPKLHVTTSTGRAVFSLPGLTRRQIEQHLGPVLGKNTR